MKITIETNNKKVVVEVDSDHLSLYGLMDELVLPAILGMGYDQSNIEDYIVEKASMLE